jgi:hypothetical protein
MARADIDYDFEDFGMTAAELEAKYAPGGRDEHPVFVRPAYEVYAAMPTRDVKLSYWDWVVREIKKDEVVTPSTVQEPPAQAFQDQLTEQQAADTEMVSVDTVDQFAEYVAHWHAKRMAQLRHFQKMPEGQTVTVTLNGVKSDVVLTGEAYKGFQAGLLTAILQIDSLPFAVTVSDAVDGTVVPGADADAPKH